MKYIIKTIFFKLIKKKAIIDVTGTVLTPGNGGRNCKGNGEYTNWRGKLIECCCDECDYYICCTSNACVDCDRHGCPYE